jgi:tetratricopeptide (TPR) repeat protein
MLHVPKEESTHTGGALIMKSLAKTIAFSLLLIVAAQALADDQGEIVQPVDVYIRSAKIALASRPIEYQRALKNLYIARDNYPDNYEVHFWLGSIWADKDEIDSMVVEFALAKEYSTTKDWIKRANDVEKIYEGKWLDRFNRAVMLVNQSDTTEEQMATLEDPGKKDSLRFILGEIRKMAKEALRHCTMLRPTDFRAFSTRGLIYQRQSIVDSSLADFVHAESLFHRFELGDSTTNWYDTTTFFAGPEGKPTKAFEEYDKKYKKLSAEKRTRYHNLMVSLIAAYYDTQQWDQAVAVGRRYYGLEPDDINNIVTMADIFSRLEREEEAFRWQEAVVRGDPGSKDTWYNMGIFYYNTAVRLQDSVQRYETQLEATPNDKQVAQVLNEFLRKRLDNFYKAVPRFQKVVEIDSKDEDTWRLLAICNYSLASLLSELQAAGNVALIEEIVGASAYDPTSLWNEAETALAKANNYFPFDKNLCYMMKVTLAQLRKVDELNTWKDKCP